MSAAEHVIHYDRTDLGNSIKFADAHQGQITYDHLQQRWLIWEGHFWKPDFGPLLEQKVMAFVQAQYIAATASELLKEPRERRETIHWGQACSERGINAIKRLSENLPALADDGLHWDEVPHLLGVPNGVVDLRTGELCDGRPEDRITRQTAVEFDLQAEAPRWERFLTEIHPNENDGAAIREYLHRAYGYTATSESSQHILMVLTGVGRNGKSVERNSIYNAMGDYAVSLPFSTLEMSRNDRPTNDLAKLRKARMAISSEANKGVKLDTQRIKSLTGEDPITARFLHKEFTTFTSTATIWLAVNDRPSVSDESEGFWLRVRAIPYPRTFEGLAADDTLNDLFKTTEARGILAWIVRGAMAFYQHGLGPVPNGIAQTTEQYRAENDPVIEFFGLHCEKETTGKVTVTEFFQEYREWEQRQGITGRDCKQRKDVMAWLRAHFPEPVASRGFTGLRLLSQPKQTVSAWEAPDPELDAIFAGVGL